VKGFSSHKSTAPAGSGRASRSRDDPGFTLVEMMVVLTILALASTLVLLNGPGLGPSLSREADEFAGRLSAARDMALIANRAVSVTLTPDGYDVKVRSRAGWVPPGGERAFTGWADGTSASRGEAPLPATLTFDSIGLAEPMRIWLYRNGSSEVIAIDGAGNVGRLRPDER